MSYPGHPGSSSSLPPRPPPSKVSGFKPAFRPVAPPPTTYTASSASSYASAPANAPQYGAVAPSSHYPQSYGAQSTPMSNGVPYQQHGTYQYPQQRTYHQSYYGAQSMQTAGASSYATPPQIRNPFPVPGQTRNDDYDQEMAAQIAQWQSAYARDPKDAVVTSGPPGRPGTMASNTPAHSLEAANRASEAAANAAALGGDRKKTVVRSGGGQKWTDDTLLEWDPSHLRLFVGNLAGETTDESLFKAFSRWKSLQKARVIRDKVTSKSKGFGFVSFSDPDEFFAAAKEMNGKYIQSHPVVVRKSTTEIKPQVVKDKHHGGRWNKNKNKNKNRSGNGNGAGGRDGAFEPHLGPTPGGVMKPGSKTKDGLRLLG
ncbi:RNA-binding domain-containing protein [Xylaria nigripes]|nr:RNA-binding domain-containing protein [Xylaria nigripes]